MSEITIAGNLGQDPELRFAQSGKANVRLSVAVTTGREDTKQTHWFEVKCWDTLAERMAELTKGTRVIVKGRMKEDSWESKDGQKRSQHAISGRISKVLGTTCDVSGGQCRAQLLSDS